MDQPRDFAMRRFNVTATDAGARVTTVQYHAPDAGTARLLAQQQGLRVLSCNPAASGFARGGGRAGMPRLAPVRLDVGLFAHELGTLLDAGLGIIDAIDTLADKERLPAAREVLRQLVSALKEGRSLSSALQDKPAVFPELLVASIAASEQTGHMAAGLQRYAANFESLRAIRAKALGSLVYPALLLLVGSGVVLFLLGFVVPRFSVLIESTRGEIPLASRILLDVGKTVHANGQLAAVAMLGLGILTAWRCRQAARAGWNLPLLQRIPVIGRLTRTFRTAQFYRTAGMLVEAGIPAVRALEMCASLLTPQDARGLRVAVEAMRAGEAIGPALQASGMADPVALRMLAVAQRTGRLAEILSRIAGFQESSLLQALDVATRLFEPMLMIFIGLVIGGVVVLMYLPIFDLASSIQ